MTNQTMSAVPSASSFAASGSFGVSFDRSSYRNSSCKEVSSYTKIPSYKKKEASGEEEVSRDAAIHAGLFSAFAKGALVGLLCGLLLILLLLEIPGFSVPTGMILFVSACLFALLFYFLRLFGMLFAFQR